jgi:hypothetical protein
MKTETDALEWLKLNEFPYWRVTERDSSKNILASKENEENENQKIDVQDSSNFFEKGAKLLPDGFYIVYGRRNPKGTAGEKQYAFEKNENQTPKPNNNDVLANIGSLSNIHATHIGLVVDYERKLSEERNRYNDLKFEKELRIKDLEAQIREAKKEDNTFDKFVAIAGVFDKWFGGSPAQATVAGTQAQTNPNSNSAINGNKSEKEIILERIGGAINILANIIQSDEKTAQAMENLAKFAQKQPGAFLTYIETLKNYA